MSYICKNYDFGSYTRIINYYLEDIYNDSVSFYKKNYGDVHPTGTKELDERKIIDFIGYIEDYLFYIYKVYNESFLDVFTALSQKLKYVSVLAPCNRGLFGAFFENSSLLEVSPVLSGSRNLSSDERTRLYVGHELGHISNSYWVSDAQVRMKADSNSNVMEGMSLLDEAITQSIAEDFAYCFACKDRPLPTLRKNLPRNGHYIFNGEPYKSNYDFYGELQEPTIMFARTLRGIGKINDDYKVMHELCKRSFSHDFFKDIAKEYVHDGRVDDLIELLENMGIIKAASYALFGVGDVKNIDDSKKAKDNVVRLSRSLKDTRDPIML